MSNSNNRKKVKDLRIPYNFTNNSYELNVAVLQGDQEGNVPVTSQQNENPGQVFDNDLSKLLEKHHFGEYSYGRSFPSKGMFSISIPNPINPTAKFVYNYYTPNERAFIESEDKKSVLYDSSLYDQKDIAFIAMSEQTPRYIKLDFKPPKAKDEYVFQSKFETIKVEGETIEDIFMGSFADINENVSLEEIANKIIIEGASSDLDYTGVEIIDTFADKKIYNMLSASITFQELSTPLDSPKERAIAFRNKILDSETNTPNPTGMEKIELIDILSEMQPEGILLAPNDVGEEVADLASDPLSKQSFSTKFNNLFFNDIIDYNTITMNTIYEDELRALKNISSRIQNNAILKRNKNSDYTHSLPITPISFRDIKIRQSDIENLFNDFEQIKNETVNYLESLSAQQVQNSGQNFFKSNQVLLYQAILRGLINPLDFLMNKQNIPNIQIIGYMIQKTEILSDGSVQEFPNIYIDNPKNFSTFIDKQVRYGAVYNYKIRTLALVESCIEVDNLANGESKLTIAKYLIASDGTTISEECEEFLPPPEPVRINAFIDYKYRKPTITWEFPLNKQRDIKRFQIFKRKNIQEPFTLVAEYDFDNSIYRVETVEEAQSKNYYRLAKPYKRYRDRDFNLDFDEAIYAIASVDAHGYTSGYSSQLHIKYDKYTNKLEKNIVSFKSAPKPYPNLYIQEDFFKDLITSSGKKRCNIFFDPEYYKLFRKVRVESEDINETGIEMKDIDYIRTSDTEYNYTFQIINVDLQKSKNIKIRIADKSGRQINVPASKISKTNLNFEFGSND